MRGADAAHVAVRATARRTTLPARDFLVEALVDGLAGAQPALASYVVLPAPIAPPEALLGAMAGPAAVFHPADSSSPAVAGVGAARTIKLDGAGRFDALREAASSVFAELRVLAHPDVDWVPRPRLLGGFAFAPGAAAESAWRAFGDGSFVLPRWTYSREGHRATLAYVGSPTSDRRAIEAILEEHERIERVLAAASGPSSEAPSRPAARLDVVSSLRAHQPGAAAVSVEDELSEGRWRDLVEDARGEIARGRFQKIVLARRTTLAFAHPLDAAEVLDNLGAVAPGCTRFAFRRGDVSFLGATPERLIDKRGTHLRTEALAGSISTSNASDTAAPAIAIDDLEARGRQLLASAKDLDEHRFVVEEIVRRLSPRCRALNITQPPRVRALRHVLHLHTPIDAELSAPAHVLDLVEALHPTPAVGGLPARDAIEWIAAHEPAPRGWYASPIGWFDAAGDGEFAVALRSGLLDGARAMVYAGAGIVAASDPDAEYAETALKQRAFLAALGVAARVPDREQP